MQGANVELLDLEDLEEKELDEIRAEYQVIASKAHGTRRKKPVTKGV
jgi:hypothetical protein